MHAESGKLGDEDKKSVTTDTSGSSASSNNENGYRS